MKNSSMFICVLSILKHFCNNMTGSIKQICLFIFILFSLIASAQRDSCQLRISLLTCSPGAELYSAFGHTAIRVSDPQRGMDLVFNYGTFNDEDPDFYLNFTKGLMNYALSCYPFENFMEEYNYEQRGVTEQVLNLSCEEKIRLFEALRINTLDENRFYNYYFHTDNCTTRARDIITSNSSSPIIFKNILPEEKPSYRNLIHEYLDKGEQYWSKLGIDILLGSNLDKKVDNQKAMFLPDYLARGFEHAETKGHSLVSATATLLPVMLSIDNTGLFTPLILFSFIFLVVLVLSFYSKTRSSRLWLVFDLLFFFALGLLGVLLCTLWLVRIDDVCRNNYNLLWALPVHIVTPFLLLTKHTNRFTMCFRIICLICLIILLLWFIIPQQLNTAVLPLIGVIFLRSYARVQITGGRQFARTKKGSR